MKFFSILLFTLLLSKHGVSQSKLDTTGKDNYCIVHLYTKLEGTFKTTDIKLYAVADFGQIQNMKEIKDYVIKDNEGNTIFFNSVAQLVNFFDNLGWDLHLISNVVGWDLGFGAPSKSQFFFKKKTGIRKN